MARKKSKPEQESLAFGPEPLEPHMTEYRDRPSVAVVRIPAGTSAKERTKAYKKLRLLAKGKSAVEKYYNNYRKVK